MPLIQTFLSLLPLAIFRLTAFLSHVVMKILSSLLCSVCRTGNIHPDTVFHFYLFMILPLLVLIQKRFMYWLLGYPPQMTRQRHFLVFAFTWLLMVCPLLVMYEWKRGRMWAVCRASRRPAQNARRTYYVSF